MTGHLLGAAGALESIVCIKAIGAGVIPPTINLESPDDDCLLDHVRGDPREVEVRSALNNSFGFGGHNAPPGFTSPDALGWLPHNRAPPGGSRPPWLPAPTPPQRLPAV